MTARVRRGARKSVHQKRRFGKKAVLAVIVFVFLAGAGAFFLWARSELFGKGQERLTAVFNTRPLLVTSYNRKQENLLFLIIPENLQLPVSGGYGSYPATSVWRLADQEKKGEALVAKSFRELLGIPVDFVFDLGGRELAAEENQFLADWLSKFSFGCLFDRSECKAMSRREALEIWLGLKRISLNNITSLSLKSLPGTREEALPDGSRAITVDQEGLDLFLRRFVTVDEVKKEAISLGVFNATGHPGLAKRASRILSNLGGRVLLVDDWDQQIENCELRTGAEVKKSVTYQLIKRIFDCVDGPEQGTGETDLTILIGKTYLREL